MLKKQQEDLQNLYVDTITKAYFKPLQNFIEKNFTEDFQNASQNASLGIDYEITEKQKPEIIALITTQMRGVYTISDSKS
jgi:hypothetical protein